MPAGLRASEAPLIQSLIGSDQRLLMRLGALLHAKLAVTRAVLEELPRAPELRKLLMDATLKDADGDGFATIVINRGCTDLDLCLLDQDEDWRVIAFTDEVDNPLMAGEVDADNAAPALAGMAGVAELLPSLEPKMRGPVEGLLAAQADEQRAAALEQLRYAAPSMRLVSELMPMVLADGADLVRERAIALVVAAGARPLVVDLIRALQKDDEVAIARLADNLQGLPDEQMDLVVAAILAALGRGKVSPALIQLCTTIAVHLSHHRGLSRLLELLVPHSRNLSLMPLVRQLQANNPATNSILESLLGQGDDLDARVIVLLAQPGRADEDRLSERGVELLLSPHEEPSDRMALGAALKRLDHDKRLAARIAQRGEAILAARESTVYWLLAELCRSDSVSPEDAEILLDVIRAAATRRAGPHLVAILEQQLPALLPASGGARASLIEPLAELTVRFRDQRSIELIQEVIIGMGPNAITSLWDLLAEHPNAKVRRLSVIALGRLHGDRDQATVSDAVSRLIKTARSTSEREEKGLILAVAAEMAQNPVVTDGSLSNQVDEGARGMGDQALAVWGHVAAGPHVSPERRSEILELLLVGITADLPDLPAEQMVDPNTQDTTYVLDERLGSHTFSVPVMLTALRRMGASEHLPAPLLRRMVSELCRQWKRVSSWEVIWGPGNVQDLGATLGSLAQAKNFPSSLRLQVAEALLPRVSQLAIAANLAQVFLSESGQSLADLAARSARSLMQAASRGEFADDERGDLADVIVNFLLIPNYGEGADAITRRLAGLLGSYRSHISLRSRERLRAEMDRLDQEVVERLSWV
ncbi:MAG: hypothetical protein PF961_07625 [Planctomycetota bacterium]|jgi:hypothetical protein|nr:hypothetical protein [Planctomycetota bacterium]